MLHYDNPSETHRFMFIRNCTISSDSIVKKLINYMSLAVKDIMWTMCFCKHKSRLFAGLQSYGTGVTVCKFEIYLFEISSSPSYEKVLWRAICFATEETMIKLQLAAILRSHLTSSKKWVNQRSMASLYTVPLNKLGIMLSWIYRF